MKPETFSIAKIIAFAAAIAILAIAMLGSAYTLSRFMLKIQREHTVYAKGYAEKTVRADLGAFDVESRINDPALANGAKRLEEQNLVITQIMARSGFAVSEIEASLPVYQRVTKKINGKDTNDLDHYELCTTITVRSRKINRLAIAAGEIAKLIVQGRTVSVLPIRYFIADPEKYKLELARSATQSAMTRAQAMASECGGRVANILSARQGIIQITAPASSETSDYGVYDTGSMDKVIKMVVSLELSIH
ncbi:MAG: SIMPL domain-containing protein [Victivallaceae bacterium]|nr:SIMPL domain-containing protein [Victivallaceae bacterium]